MAANILTYTLSAKSRISITSKAPSPNSIISSGKMARIEKERQAHIKKFGHEFG